MESRLGFAVIGLLGGATWLLSHGYQGIFHDGYLYALQALARIHPELAADVFLKFGSQDQFSIFSPLYAFAVRNMGLENAAAALTLLFQLAFLAGAWALARTLTASSGALLGVCVLIAIPGTYGADRVFSCMETFLTPRMAAEALALAGLGAALASRYRLAAAFIIVAALVHPIMAAAAIVCLWVLYLGIPRPRWALAALVIALLGYAAPALIVGGDTWGRFDPRWFALVQARSPYLFVTNWSVEDWAPLCVTLATLTIGVAVPADMRSRRFVLAVLITVVLGFGLTWVACDWLHLILPTQVQPWRWQWLGTAVAALLLPTILQSRWRLGIAGRTSALLLIAAWIFASNPFAMVAAAASTAALLFMGKLKPHEARHMVWGSWALLALAGAWRIGSNLEFTDVHYLDLQAPLWVRRAMSFAHDGTVPVALVGLTWYLAGSRRRLAGLLAVAAAAMALIVALVPEAWAMWTATSYSRQTIAAFAPLRDKIPPGADVFWPESPAAAWALLDVPSYLSVTQTSGLVFSRAGAVELDRRAFALESAISPGSFMNWDTAAEHMNLSREQLARVCATGEFNFLVTHLDLGVQPVVDVPTGRPPRSLHLYRCAQSATDAGQARAAAAST